MIRGMATSLNAALLVVELGSGHCECSKLAIRHHGRDVRSSHFLAD